MKLLILTLLLASCGVSHHHHNPRQKVTKVDQTPWGIEEVADGFYQRHCGDYLFVYYANTLNGYKNLDHFLMYKTSLDSAARIVNSHCRSQ